MEVDAAPRAPAIAGHGKSEKRTAAGTAKYFVRCHQVGRARTGSILQHPARRARWLLRRLVRPGPPLARLVLIAALPILPVAHLFALYLISLQCDSVVYGAMTAGARMPRRADGAASIMWRQRSRP
jgi:hypothetical protein